MGTHIWRERGPVHKWMRFKKADTIYFIRWLDGGVNTSESTEEGFLTFLISPNLYSLTLTCEVICEEEKKGLI